MRKKRRGSVELGFTLIELLITLSVMGILMGIGILSVKELHNDAQSAGSIVTGALLQARSLAISTTSNIRATLSGSATLTFESNPSTCTATTGWVAASSLQQGLANRGLPPGVTITGNSPWSVCFRPRGDLAAVPASALTIKDTRNHQRTLTVYITGNVENSQ